MLLQPSSGCHGILPLSIALLKLALQGNILILQPLVMTHQGCVLSTHFCHLQCMHNKNSGVLEGQPQPTGVKEWG